MQTILKPTQDYAVANRASILEALEDAQVTIANLEVEDTGVWISLDYLIDEATEVGQLLQELLISY